MRTFTAPVYEQMLTCPLSNQSTMTVLDGTPLKQSVTQSTNGSAINKRSADFTSAIVTFGLIFESTSQPNECLSRRWTSDELFTTISMLLRAFWLGV